ncbi:hypothetical protein, partial [Sulfurihydrogenibium azorense]|uniref:hypothetical protein n=1 Tax=Sulfurihydrogenibium azorense TaxID=309806 RepID=UPI00391D04CE
MTVVYNKVLLQFPHSREKTLSLRKLSFFDFNSLIVGRKLLGGISYERDAKRSFNSLIVGRKPLY